ncbi:MULTISPECIES: LacI family DNA-binding transcriptional regulator [unclassified Nocardiopsis]|uniref:LacI family DNA-binding transcriptional regulator n=1 Tax=unclassified Nocardiopsis TaxID=2649073 RepID=UPI00066BC344|nr:MULTISPECIES: LacI family DNA-binding transcriptional regulator [unclassified Nocardiopsis]MBQ1081998.1 LacI family DNA-binding transcriptional regulator [Nocardiopsis sp. B62]
MNTPRRTTIYDVAAEAGVAASTVSRTFGNPRRVNATTRDHVLRVAERLGYRPNPLATALQSGHKATIAMLVPDITNPHFFGTIRGAERRASEAGVTFILGNTEESAAHERNQIERLDHSVDGFVLAASRMSDETTVGISQSHNLALVNREVDGLPGVVVDSGPGSWQIVEHLASLGHRSIVYLSGPHQSWLANQRWKALRAAAERRGLSVARLGPFPPRVSGGGAAADAALVSGATALVAHNDLLAIGVLRRLSERGVAVPGEVSVVGYDDIFGADLCVPALTTLAGPEDEAGRVAVELLLRKGSLSTAHPAPQRVVLPTHLVIRDSTGPAAR